MKLNSWKYEGLVALVFYFSLSLSLTACFSREQVALDKTVLSINGTKVSTKEFANRLAVRLKNYDALYAKDESVLDRAKEETVQAFVIETIARRYATEKSITVSESEVDTEVAKVKSRYPDEFAFRRSLANENMPLEDWRKDLELTILQKKIFESITKDIPQPTESRLKSYYETNKAEFQNVARIKLRQIVLEKEDDAKRIQDELIKGSDMASLAKKFSVAPEADNGGETAWIEKGALEVFDQAFRLNIGARSKIVKSPYGYHIYEVLKKEPEARLSFLEAKAKIAARLMEEDSQKAFTSWLELQVRKSTVRRDDAVIRAIKVTTRGS